MCAPVPIKRERERILSFNLRSRTQGVLYVQQQKIVCSSADAPTVKYLIGNGERGRHVLRFVGSWHCRKESRRWSRAAAVYFSRLLTQDALPHFCPLGNNNYQPFWSAHCDAREGGRVKHHGIYGSGDDVCWQQVPCRGRVSPV